MKLKHFEQKGKTIVGDYMPSPDWSKFTHFAVMNESDCGLIASVGFFNRIGTPETWDFNSYLEAAKSIEQAQLYGNAHRLFDLLDRFIGHSAELSMDVDALHVEAYELLSEITDISEAATRLLGADAMKIIEEAERRNNEIEREKASQWFDESKFSNKGDVKILHTRIHESEINKISKE